MKKKWVIVCVLMSCLLGFVFLNTSPLAALPKYCAFCDPAVIVRQKIYEDEQVMILCTHKPIVPGHTLVIPKRHVERFEEVTKDEIAEMGEALKKVNAAASKIFETTGYILLQKNGVEAGQSVPHVHFHYIPRKAGDYTPLGFLLRMHIAYLKAPLSQEKMELARKQMQDEINR